MISTSYSSAILKVLLTFKLVFLLDHDIAVRESSFNNGEGLIGKLRPENIFYLTYCCRKTQTLSHCSSPEDMEI